MHLWSLDHEVRSCLARTSNLWPDACIPFEQASLLQRWEVSTDSRVEPCCGRRVEGVVDIVDPRDVGPESRGTRDVERHVDTKTARFRDGVDKVPKRRPSGEREVVPLCEVCHRD